MDAGYKQLNKPDFVIIVNSLLQTKETDLISVFTLYEFYAANITIIYYATNLSITYKQSVS